MSESQKCEFLRNTQKNGDWRDFYFSTNEWLQTKMNLNMAAKMLCNCACSAKLLVKIYYLAAIGYKMISEPIKKIPPYRKQESSFTREI